MRGMLAGVPERRGKVDRTRRPREAAGRKDSVGQSRGPSRGVPRSRGAGLR